MYNRQDWKIRVPWGRLALMSHGHPDGPPVLMVHGRQDSASIFEPLVEQMSEGYYFVVLDMPGNGLSDAFPPGPKLMRFHFLAAMEFAIKHLGWDKFIFMGHSMGCEQGLFYNVIHPGQITKMILLDAGPTLMRMQVEDHFEYQRYYDSYYEKYMWENFNRKPYTKEKALQTIQRHRDLTRSQSLILLSRNFHTFPLQSLQNSKESLTEDDGLDAVYKRYDKTRDAEDSPSTDGNDNTNEPQNAAQDNSDSEALNPSERSDRKGLLERMRKNDKGYLSWDNRLKNLAPQNYGNDYYFALFKTIPPTLLIAASDGAKNIPPNPKWRQGAKELLDRMATLDNFHRVDVEGGHDVHFTHPEKVLPYIKAFLKDSKVFSKL